MRKLKLQVQLTIDGFVAGNDGEMDWMTYAWDDELKNYVTALTDPVDQIVLGRKLAEGFIPYWAHIAADPEAAEHSAGLKFTATPKLFFSRTLRESPWDNTTLADRELVDAITRLKAEPGQDIIAYGGATFASALIQAGLIDDYYLFINPAAIGSGKRIFGELTQRLSLQLVEAIPFSCGIVLIHYQPI